MKRATWVLGLLSLCAARAGMADVVNYNTAGSGLSCNGVAGCSQVNPFAVTLDGLVLAYIPGAGGGITTPSAIGLGEIGVAGLLAPGAVANLSGLTLTLNINSTPPGSGGALPTGLFQGSLTMNTSSATLDFGPGNTTSGYGTLPGVLIGNELYQILASSPISVLPPLSGSPPGFTVLHGAVSTVPLPASAWLLLTGLAGLGGLARRRRGERLPRWMPA